MSTLGPLPPPRASVESGQLLLRATRESPSLTKRHALPTRADPSPWPAQHPANELLPHDAGHVPRPHFVQTLPPRPIVGSNRLLDRLVSMLCVTASKKPSRSLLSSLQLSAHRDASHMQRCNCTVRFVIRQNAWHPPQRTLTTVVVVHPESAIAQKFLPTMTYPLSNGLTSSQTFGRRPVKV